MEKIGTLVKLVNAMGQQSTAKIDALINKLMAEIERVTKTPFARDVNWMVDLPFEDQIDVLLLMDRHKQHNKVDNYHFVPKLKEKLNSKSPWHMEEPKSKNQFYPNPYTQEINSIEYPEYYVGTIIKSKPMGSCEFIDKKEQLESLMEHLSQFNEIAIDLEHHSEESYLGITCLMQLSTRENDYLIDTIALKDDLQCLNLYFTDQKITKVLHGAKSDIIWLQRDLGLYIVNLFDTYHAAKSLGKKRQSLGVLLQDYCNYTTDKSYQRADWRIRPLTSQMTEYAQADTHFLLEVYDNLRNEVIEANLLQHCQELSAATCLQSFYIPEYDLPNGDTPGWRASLNKYTNEHPGKDKLNIVVFKQIHYWRDSIARKVDVSPTFLIPQWQMNMLANRCPTTLPHLHKALRYKHSVQLESYFDELLELIISVKSNIDESVKMEPIEIEKPLPAPSHIVFDDIKDSKTIINSVNQPQLTTKSQYDLFNHIQEQDYTHLTSILSEFKDTQTENTKAVVTVNEAPRAKQSTLDEIIAIEVPKKRISETVKTKIDKLSGIEVADVKRSKRRSKTNKKKEEPLQEQEIVFNDPNPMKLRKTKAKPKKRKFTGKKQLQNVLNK